MSNKNQQPLSTKIATGLSTTAQTAGLTTTPLQVLGQQLSNSSKIADSFNTVKMGVPSGGLKGLTLETGMPTINGKWGAGLQTGAAALNYASGVASGYDAYSQSGAKTGIGKVMEGLVDGGINTAFNFFGPTSVAGLGETLLQDDPSSRNLGGFVNAVSSIAGGTTDALAGGGTEYLGKVVKANREGKNGAFVKHLSHVSDGFEFYRQQGLGNGLKQVGSAMYDMVMGDDAPTPKAIDPGTSD